MQYDTNALIQQALDFGFTHAGELNVSSLVFMPEIRQMCNSDKCRSFGHNWRCPPACGSLEESAAAASRYSYGILVQTVGEMEDDFDYETVTNSGIKHKANFAKLTDALKEHYSDVLPMGAGGCTICEKCTYPDAPCRFPDRAITSMEAYGLWVNKVCENSGLPYNYGPHTIAYVSCYLLK